MSVGLLSAPPQALAATKTPFFKRWSVIFTNTSAP
jgi:hypothetical protein